MTGALLSEVWPDMVQKPRKSKRLKKKKSGDPLMTPPLEPDEMETELLDDRTNENRKYKFKVHHETIDDQFLYLDYCLKRYDIYNPDTFVVI